MNGLKPIKMPSAKEKVAAELRKAILSRQMKEGEVLSLESVATQLNVSAMPVREAFQILARDGLIQLRKNRGAVVLGITETYIKEHYQLRAILESAAASLAAEQETDISEIESVYEEAEEDLKEGNLKQYTDLNHAFHHEIWSAAGNQKMKNMISELWNGLSMGSMVSEEDYAKVSIKEHERIWRAIKAHDQKEAQMAMYDHIMRSRDDISALLFTFVVNNNALFCISMQEKLPVAGPFNTKNAEYGDFEQKTIYSFITYAKIYKYLLTFLSLRSIL